MYSVDNRQFSVMSRIPRTLMRHGADYIKEMFSEYVESAFGRVSTHLEVYSYKFDLKCRFTVIFTDSQSNPKDVERSVSAVVKWMFADHKVEEAKAEAKRQKYLAYSALSGRMSKTKKQK